MSEPIARGALPAESTWKLEDMYESDAAWEAAFSRAQEAVAVLPGYAGQLGDRARLLAALGALFDAERQVSNLFTYARMRLDEDMNRTAYQALSDRAQALLVSFETASSFVGPELLALPMGALSSAAADPAFADYDRYLHKLERERPHTLSAAEERIIAMAGELAEAPDTIYSRLTDADLTFDPIEDEDGKPLAITQATFVPTLMRRDRRVRRDAFESYYRTLKRFKNTIPAAYAASVKADLFHARVRNFGSAREMNLHGDNIPLSVYDNLIEASRRHTPALNRFFERNAQLLGIDDLSFFDLYVTAPQGFSIDLAFDEAYDLVVDCLKPLGEAYQAMLLGARRDRWIDPLPTSGKRSGAYAWGTYDSHPYVLLNHHEDLDGLTTIAHEMGHAMHSYHCFKAQPYAKSNYSLFVAEVASTVNEVLVFLELLDRYPDKAAQAYLLSQLLDSYRTTLFRQVLFAEFERESHAMAEAGEALTSDNLNALYARLNRDYYPAVQQSGDIAYEWMRIPHFYRAFYVYVYATGFSAATAIAAMIREEGEPAVARYRAFLSAGNSLDPIDTLKLTGLDMTTPEPVERALTLFESLLERYIAATE